MEIIGTFLILKIELYPVVIDKAIICFEEFMGDQQNI